MSKHQLIQSDGTTICLHDRAVPYDALYRSVYAQFPQQSRAIGRSSFSMIKARQDAHSTTDPAVDHVILRALNRASMQKNTVDCGDGTRELKRTTGSLYVTPPNAVTDWSADGPHDITLLAIPRRHLAELVDAEDAGEDPLAPLYHQELRDPILTRMMDDIWQGSEDGGDASSLMVDGMFLVLLSRLMRQGEARKGRTAPCRQPSQLDPVRLSRVLEFMNANLEAALPMHKLADVACLSQHHFARAFRTSTGQAPHAYLTAQRIARARELLAKGTDSVAEIAQMCGFGSQSHLTAAFKKAMGVPPATYRRSLSGRVLSLPLKTP